MSLPFLFRRGISSTLTRSYRPKKIPEELVVQATKPKRGRPKKIVNVDEGEPPKVRAPKRTVLSASSPSTPVYNPGNKLELPPASEWRRIFPSSPAAVKDRISIRNPETAALIADSFVPAGSEGKVIIEAYPGPGALTRALMQLPKERIRKIIVLEANEMYLDYLKPLEKADSRVQVLSMAGFSWDTYHHLDTQGVLDDIEPIPWSDGVHPRLQFISHLPMSVLGEQLIAQFFRCIPEQIWLFKYGRVPMSYIMHDWVWERLSAGTGPRDVNRCKLSVMTQVAAHCEESIDGSALLPYDDHFHPPVSNATNSIKPDNRRKGTPMVAINVTPLKRQLIEKGMLDKWDYCLRRLFVLKSTALKSAIGHLAPGASVLTQQLMDQSLPESQRMDTKKQIRRMSVEDWAAVVGAFDRWPFAPEDLLISDSFSRDERL
ncbi:S-adenosyl-L-methionine-dependent methyltransferase [Hygrophoropsis aurantiaca]|uniref:S-adenosyl-L-methionine-dependent methyltransferase n=1 Tax=Hygrophoropsis aurantiaca TaxID=72124 RepID=A0ACB8AMI2_9AGAM|nr:S-adenosyl-L-methionine-dependent methyltransferase [Hygrophoropsis aurantiaca]